MRSRTRSLSVRCEQGAKGGSGGLDVWLSRGAMLGFVGAVAVELTTGKGVLQVTLAGKFFLPVAISQSCVNNPWLCRTLA